MNFKYREEENGTFGLYNTKIGDIYYSNIGAHKEALEKFVLPADIKSHKNKKMKILDVCFGMGYNSKTFVDYCLKNNFDFEFEIDAIEIDKNIIAVGLLNFDSNISSDVHTMFGQKILNQINIEENLNKILGDFGIKKYLEHFKGDFCNDLLKNGIDLYKNNKNINVLHNIYYQNHANSYKSSGSFEIFMKIGDLNSIIKNLNKKYDYIFHDAFSIRKQPELWSKDIFARYFELLEDNGKLLTYSNSRVLRREMLEIGFIVDINSDNAGKQNGTIGKKT